MNDFEAMHGDWHHMSAEDAVYIDPGAYEASAELALAVGGEGAAELEAAAPPAPSHDGFENDLPSVPVPEGFKLSRLVRLPAKAPAQVMGHERQMQIRTRPSNFSYRNGDVSISEGGKTTSRTDYSDGKN